MHSFTRSRYVLTLSIHLNLASVLRSPEHTLKIYYFARGSLWTTPETLLTTFLHAQGGLPQHPPVYIKPVQTGFPEDSDGQLISHAAQCKHTLGSHARTCAGLTTAQPPETEAVNAYASTLFAWKNAVSPHLAVKLEGRPVQDAELVAAIADEIRRFSPRLDGHMANLVLVETAGGPCSPAPSGTLQVMSTL